ncbi:glycerol-3-phosphate acyltransferase 3-like [Silurus meridionalis]|nr:glycerol-3-phosphate acyltransferase 3-like [Silurus meridionalis]
MSFLMFITRQVGQVHGGLMGVVQRAMVRACPHIWFERAEMKDRHLVTQRLKDHINDKNKLLILIFPEGTCINNTSVMMFKKGSFEIGGTIYPVAIKYDPLFGDAFWNSGKYSMVSYLLRMMTSWAIVCNVWYLPPMTQQEEEDAVQFANRVKSLIARQGGLVDLSWDGGLKRAKVKDTFKQEQQKMYSSMVIKREKSRCAMQFFSIHHCVLILFTLTFTTVPTQAYTSVMVKLNQSAVLPCEQNCSGFVRWTVADEPHEIVAQCNYTSCWSKEGFKISHDEYLKGNLSLTITAVDYSNRGLYTCERGCINIINTVRLSNELRTLYIDLKSGEDLVLDVHMPGPKEVTYKSKDQSKRYSELICSVIQQLLECKDEYTPRVALSDAGLILEKVTLSDSGFYSVWDKNNNDINLSYIVSVKKRFIDSVRVKIHGSVTLPCTRDCAGVVQWTHRGKVVAQCNETSCQSEEGYKMFRDQHNKDNLSLSITEANYSTWGVYECKCNNKTVNEQRVSIDDLDSVPYVVAPVAQNSSVHLKPGDNLFMDFPIAEEVKVIYNGSVIYSYNPIDNPPNKVDYTHRLLNILKLEKVNMYDSGNYIIQNTENEALLIYNVTVKDHSAHGLELRVPLWASLGVVFFNSYP